MTLIDYAIGDGVGEILHAGHPSEEGLDIVDRGLLNEVRAQMVGGVFENDPQHVASAFADALRVHGSAFEHVTFAIPLPETDHVYHVFESTFERTSATI